MKVHHLAQTGRPRLDTKAAERLAAAEGVRQGSETPAGSAQSTDCEGGNELGDGDPASTTARPIAAGP